MDHVYTMFLQYRDDSEVTIEIGLDGAPSEHLATLMMVARGTLMASMANKVIVYDSEGFDVISYIK